MIMTLVIITLIALIVAGIVYIIVKFIQGSK